MKIFDADPHHHGCDSGDAKSRGYNAGTFSLNVDGGRCPVCKGLGYEFVDMLFMDDIEIKCDACDGKRFRPEILEVRYKGKNIDDILNMTVARPWISSWPIPMCAGPLARSERSRPGLFESRPKRQHFERRRIAAHEAGARIGRLHQQRTLYILDEPTTGLHFREVHLLLKVLNRLVEAGSSVLLVEHNLEIIKHSDYVIDLGPEAGDKGGEIIGRRNSRRNHAKGREIPYRPLFKAYVETKCKARRKQPLQ